MDREYRPAPMSLAQRAALRSQQPRVLRQPAHRRVYPIVIVLVIVLVCAAAVSGFEYSYRDRVLPRVHISAAGLDVSGMTRQEVANRLADLYARSIFRVVTLDAPGGPSMARQAHQIGYSFDRNLTAWRAWTVGHYGSLQDRVTAQARALTKGTDVAVAQSVDPKKVTAFLVIKVVPAMNRPPRPGVAGRKLDVTLARQRIIDALLHNMSPAIRVALPFTTIPALPVPKPKPAPTPPHAPKKHPIVKH